MLVGYGIIAQWSSPPPPKVSIRATLVKTEGRGGRESSMVNYAKILNFLKTNL